MKRPLLILLIVAFAGSAFVSRQNGDFEETIYKNLERRIELERTTSVNTIQYDIEPINQGNFKLVFQKKPTDINVEIYDILGNLLLEQENRGSLSLEFEYDFGQESSRMYVVKVASGKHHMTKKVNF